jgi:hypothetical protein
MVAEWRGSSRASIQTRWSGSYSLMQCTKTPFLHRTSPIRSDSGGCVLSATGSSCLGLARLLGPELVPLVDGPVGYHMPEDLRELIAVISTRPKNQEGNARLVARHQANDAQLRAARGLGDRPLVVLSSLQQSERLAGWDAAQAKLAALSSRGVRTVATGSHLIAWEHPDLVVSAVEDVKLAASESQLGAVGSELSRCVGNRSVDESRCARA